MVIRVPDDDSSDSQESAPMQQFADQSEEGPLTVEVGDSPDDSPESAEDTPSLQDLLGSIMAIEKKIHSSEEPKPERLMERADDLPEFISNMDVEKPMEKPMEKPLGDRIALSRAMKGLRHDIEEAAALEAQRGMPLGGLRAKILREFR